MNTKDWQKVNEIVLDALELDRARRSEFIENRCSDLTEIRREVESLLEGEPEVAAQDFFGSSAVVNYASFFNDEEAPDAVAGQEIGNYRIEREIGRGGMGAVYLGTRADGKFEQYVALKLLKRELNTKDFRRRFRHERQILATLQHPNIARLLDAGTSRDNVPFLAMEYVEGLPIDVFCNRRNYDLKQRLELFRGVCEAVAFAHRNLIVHRDLKPSNILVTDDGIPKLLDFGIAKLLTHEFEADSEHTITRLGAMTPSYASPEQLKMESVSTATDVYSLGVILYELLSGNRPFEAIEGNWQQVIKAVCETEPPPPSLVVKSISADGKRTSNDTTTLIDNRIASRYPSVAKAENKTAVNKPAHTSPQFVFSNPQQLKGDLDNIILKALKKEPDRRYSTVEFFSEDIRRHLEGLPVAARPDTFSYRAEKFVKRNRAGVFAGALVLLAIIGGVTTTLWQARIARAERTKAEKRFNDVRTLANSFLFEFSPLIENLPGSMPARKLLVERALEYLDNLSREASGDLQLQSKLARAYEKVGDVQGNPETPNVGDLKGALHSYEKAQTIRRKLLEAEPNNLELDGDLASNLEVAANINLNGGEYDKAGASLAEAVALREKVIAQKPQDFAARSNLAKALRTSGHVPFYGDEYKKAKDFYQRSMIIFADLNKESPDDSFIGYQYANTFIDVGDSFGYTDEIPQAEENIQKGLDLLIALREKHPNDNRVRRALMVAYMKRGEYYRDAGDYKNSLVKYDEALEIAQDALEIDPGNFQAKRDVVIVNKQRAVTLDMADKTKEALESFASAIEISEQLKKEDPNNIVIVYDIAGSYFQMGETQYGAGDYQSALATAQKAMDNCLEILEKNPAHTQSIRVTARAQHLKGKSYAALAEKSGGTELWQKSLENYRAGLEIYNKFKAEGKSAGYDGKTIAELETEIAKIQSKIDKK